MAADKGFEFANEHIDRMRKEGRIAERCDALQLTNDDDPSFQSHITESPDMRSTCRPERENR
jgi:hypothetical protein